jgi:hypothetical protein
MCVSAERKNVGAFVLLLLLSSPRVRAADARALPRKPEKKNQPQNH